MCGLCCSARRNSASATVLQTLFMEYHTWICSFVRTCRFFTRATSSYLGGVLSTPQTRTTRVDWPVLFLIPTAHFSEKSDGIVETMRTVRSAFVHLTQWVHHGSMKTDRKFAWFEDRSEPFHVLPHWPQMARYTMHIISAVSYALLCSFVPTCCPRESTISLNVTWFATSRESARDTQNSKFTL